MNLYPRGHCANSGGVLDCNNWGDGGKAGHSWRLVGSSQGCCSTFYNAQDSPSKPKIIRPPMPVISRLRNPIQQKRLPENRISRTLLENSKEGNLCRGLATYNHSYFKSPGRRVVNISVSV